MSKWNHPRVLIPIGALALGCAALAFGLGSSVVKPLQSLTRWLPNLSHERDAASTEISPDVFERRDEVGRLARALLDIQNQLKAEKELRARSERLAALGRIATSLAHEIKNPAAAIRMHADLLADRDSVSREDRESLDLIRDEVEQISELVNQWLFVTKPAPSAQRPNDLRTILDRVARRLQSTLTHRDIKIILPEYPAPILVNVDAPRIEQAIRNLIQNAIDAMPAGGDVEVEIQSTESTVSVSIHDNGKGFSNSARDHFGEPFYSEKEGGMGIGLTLASEVFSAHNGNLFPDKSKIRSGACVTFQLPLAEKTSPRP